MTLWNNEETSVRAVLLSANYETCVVQTIARFETATMKLITMAETGKCITFPLTATEMDTLAEQWILYRQDQRIAEEALQSAIEAILKEIPAIELKDYSNEDSDGFRIDVTIPEISHEASDFANSTKELLGHLLVAQSEWQQYQKGIALAQQAEKLVDEHPEVELDIRANGKNRLNRIWTVTVPSRGKNYRCSTPAELTAAVEEAIKLLSAEPTAEQESEDEHF